MAFDIDPLTLDAGTSYTAFAVGCLADGSFTVVPAVDAALAGVRVLHGSADAPAVDVYANGSAHPDEMWPSAPSPYLYVPAGTYQIQVVPSGATIEEGPVVIDAPLTFAGGTLTTVAASNLLATITPNVISDAPAPVADTGPGPRRPPSRRRAQGRHRRRRQRQGDAIVKNLKYGKTTKYVTVPAGEYDLEVRPGRQKEGRLRHPALTLEAGKSYSAMAIGQLGDGSFTVILAEDATAG